MMTRCNALVRFASLVALLGAAAAADAAPQMRFRGHEVTFEGLAPGAVVSVLAVTMESDGGAPPAPLQTREVLELRDQDRDGSVSYERARPAPAIGTWVLVDNDTGEWWALSPPGVATEWMTAKDAIKHSNAGQLRTIGLTVPEMYVMVVRPGVGSWHLYVAKFSRLDRSAGGDGVAVDISALLPIARGVATPSAFRKGDVVAIVEPRTLRVLVVEVGR